MQRVLPDLRGVGGKDQIVRDRRGQPVVPQDLLHQLPLPPAGIAEEEAEAVGRVAGQLGEVADVLGEGETGRHLAGALGILLAGIAAGHLVGRPWGEEHRAGIGPHRSAEVGDRLVRTLPVHLHPLEDLAHLDPRRPVQDEAEAPLLLVVDEQDHTLVEERVEHLRHGEQQHRRREVGMDLGHGAFILSRSGPVWCPPPARPHPRPPSRSPSCEVYKILAGAGGRAWYRLTAGKGRSHRRIGLASPRHPPSIDSRRFPMKDSFGSHATLNVGGRPLRIARLAALETAGHAISRLPYALRILLENLLRREDGTVVSAEEIRALAAWDPQAAPSREIAFMPARVLLQDFTGVPAVVDLAAMRDAIAAMGGDPKRINPLQPVELVIDHSVQVDEYGKAAAFLLNAEKEFERNGERYAFLRWGQTAFRNFQVVPPDTGIVHQVNLEYLARVVMDEEHEGETWAYPDTLVGTDSHTTMINGLGVLGWGVGGIEAEAAMLGQPVSMLIPQVVGFRLTGALPEGATATDLVLKVTEMLRKKGVVGQFVEFYGPGLKTLPLADRATIANMAPEYGATCGIFPVDQVALDYLRFSGRPAERIALVEAYMKEQRSE